MRGLTLAATTALVLRTVLGSGMFLKTAVMAQDVGTPDLVHAAWIAPRAFVPRGLRRARGRCC